MNSIESNLKRKSNEYISGESTDFKMWNKAFGQEDICEENKNKIGGFVLSGIPEMLSKNTSIIDKTLKTSKRKQSVKTQIDNVKIDKPKNEIKSKNNKK